MLVDEFHDDHDRFPIGSMVLVYNAKIGGILMGSMLPYIAAPWILYRFGLAKVVSTGNDFVTWKRELPLFQHGKLMRFCHLVTTWELCNELSRCCVEAFREVEEEGRAGLNSAGSPWTQIYSQYETPRAACRLRQKLNGSTNVHAFGGCWSLLGHSTEACHNAILGYTGLVLRCALWIWLKLND